MWAWAWMEWDGGGRGGDVLREGGLGTWPRAVVWGWKRGCDGRMGISSQERKVGRKASFGVCDRTSALVRCVFSVSESEVVSSK